ncbi:MAG: hypothetical protein OWT27_05110 [Firmicutes bacterium]|nr:hypothetical protein [Bacillota bacterium]
MPTSKSSRALTPALRKRIAQESRAVNLPQNRYLDLLTRLASAIRGAAFPQGIEDPELLERIVDNPLLLQLATTLAASLWQTLKDGEAPGASDKQQGAPAAAGGPHTPAPSAPATGVPPTAAPKRAAHQHASPFVGNRRPPVPPI